MLTKFTVSHPWFSLDGECYDSVSKCPEITGVFSSDKKHVQCPRCGSNKVIKHGIEKPPLTRMDIVKGKPTKVHLARQLWDCKSCGKKSFEDPNSPYQHKKGTTGEFDEWIADQLLSDPQLSQKALADSYGIPVATVNKALKKKLNKLEKGIYAAVPVKTLWLIPFDFHKKEYLLVVGENIADELFCSRVGIPQNSLILLGISDDVSFDGAIKNTRIFPSDDLKEIYCPPELDSPKLREQYSIYRFSTPKVPDEIQRLLKIIKEFRGKRISITHLRFLLLFNNAARLEEMRTRNYISLSNTSPFEEVNVSRYNCFISMDAMLPERNSFQRHKLLCRADFLCKTDSIKYIFEYYELVQQYGRSQYIKALMSPHMDFRSCELDELPGDIIDDIDYTASVEATECQVKTDANRVYSHIEQHQIDQYTLFDVAACISSGIPLFCVDVKTLIKEYWYII